MEIERIRELSRYFRQELLDDLIPFWTARMVDSQCAGFLTYLDRDGSLLCTDKSIWVQGRVSWMFARLYSDLEPREDRGHAMPMILVNVLQVMRLADPSGNYDEAIDEQIREIFQYFVKPEKRALLETVGADGELLDSPQGRCVNPGHALESAWFLLEKGKHRGDRALIERTLPIIDWSLELGWDREHGGILYFVDVEGKPPEQLEWDMKLSWVHNEALYACLLAHHLCGEKRYQEWFERILAWTLSHFPDREQGEWFGYLHRDGSVSLPFKGNNWKGPYHEHRQFLFTHLLLEQMARGASARV
jgi:N-acylglucosamine 2-epimerase